MPASNAAFVQASVFSRATPPEYVSQEPREMAETSRSESPSRRRCMRRRLPVSVGRHAGDHPVAEGVDEAAVIVARERPVRGAEVRDVGGERLDPVADDARDPRLDL